MNLAIRGISGNLGDVPENTFFRDQHKDLKADFIMANPPFNQKQWRAANELTDDHRWNGYEIPPTGNANYAWILHMASDSQFYIHQLAINTIKTLKGEALGAVFSALVTRDFDGQLVIKPTKNVIEKFSAMIESTYALLLSYENQIYRQLHMAGLLLSKMATIEKKR